MKIPSIRTRQDMEMAAELRAVGATWRTIAAQLGRQRNVVSRWVRWYQDEWERLLQDAKARVYRNGSDETLAAIRAMLRDRDSTVRLSAAQKLTKMRLDEKAAETPAPRGKTDLIALGAYLEDLSDAELDSTLDEFNREKQSAADAAG